MTTVRGIVPKQKIGSHTGATSTYIAASRDEALLMFTRCKQILVDVNNWKVICGNKGSEFWLTDDKGSLITSGIAKKGLYIRIELPAPKNKNGSGYDWVFIEAFVNRPPRDKDEEVFGFRVRPTSNPLLKNTDIAHFYDEAATSTFAVIRNGKQLAVLERGRNELPNIKVSFKQKFRNLLIAIPAMLGFSKPQWQSLTYAILNTAVAKEDTQN